MPLTRIDPHAALLVIDLQKGIVGAPTAHPAGETIAHAAQRAEAFRERGLPVVRANVDGFSPDRSAPPCRCFHFAW